MNVHLLGSIIDMVVLLGRHQTCNSQVMGSSSGEGTTTLWPWASYLYLCASIMKQYNLVPAKRQWCSSAIKVRMGLTISNSSLQLGLWQSPAGMDILWNTELESANV